MTDSLIAELLRRASSRSRRTDNRHATSTVRAPVNERVIAIAEEELGRPLPPLLRDVYCLVGDGGFGPGYGLLPLMVAGEDDDETVVGLYSAFCMDDPEDSAWSWPLDLVPFCDWGCAIRSCIDCSSSDGAVVTFDPNIHGIGDPMSACLGRTHPTLRSWFEDWIAGVQIWERMFEPDPNRQTTGINPFTKEPLTIVGNRLRRVD